MSEKTAAATRDGSDVVVQHVADGAARPEGRSSALLPEPDALRERVLADPDRVLLEIGDTRTTYREIDTRVDRLAQWLLDTLGGPDRRVGLHTTGTEALTIGALVLRHAGMVSVCLDPSAPAAWVGRALSDCGAALLLSDAAQASPAIPCPVVHPCAVGADPPPGGVQAPTGPIGSIVYTSGSTGEPKGVVTASDQRFSREFSLLGAAAQAAHPEGARFGFLGFGSVGFMESVVHLGVALHATLVGYDIRSEGIHGIGPWLAENRIWGFTAVPTVLRHVTAVLSPELQMPWLKLILLYGEATTWEDLAHLWPYVGADTTVMSFYGMSECSTIAAISVTASTPPETGSLPAGVITDGKTVTIEDANHRPLDDGEVGQIVVWTEDRAMGYWNRPEETARVFGISDDGHPYVRTGDLGRVRPDGLLEHMGRLDDMVKVSGRRVMLTEVETALARLPDVAAAAAVSRPDAQGHNRIVAFVVPDGGCTLDQMSLRTALTQVLPPAAVPDRVELATELPMLPNGKLDRLALRQEGAPAPDPRMVPASAGPAADEIMAPLLAMWTDVLGVAVHQDDNFFDLGGDSLRAGRLFAEIELQLGADLPLSLLVEAPTPRALAVAIASQTGHDNLVVPIRTEGSRPPLFIMHDLSGNVLFARDIAHQLHGDQPVYAIRGDTLNGVVTGVGSIKEVAARYVPGVLATAPARCALYGSSAGGAIAFELALQLADQGVDITFLGLGDSFGPGTDRATATEGFYPGGGQRFQRRLNDLRAAPWRSRPRLAAGFVWRRSIPAMRQRLAARHSMNLDDDDLRLAVERAGRDGTRLPRQFRGMYGLLHYGLLSADYQPERPFDGSIALLRTADEGTETLGWERYVTGTVRVFLSDFHYQLHEPAVLRRTGDVLDGALRHW